jgi:hypothetical protein
MSVTQHLTSSGLCTGGRPNSVPKKCTLPQRSASLRHVMVKIDLETILFTKLTRLFAD